jgi:peptide-methionine (R)-S-oxide reductase
VNAHLPDTVNGNLWYRQVDMNTGEVLTTRYGSLDAYLASVLCLAGDVGRAAQLQQSSDLMWDIAGIEPEAIDYSTMTIVSKGYYLRPEIIESAYYLYHYTRDPRYRTMGLKYFRSIVKYCRTGTGYAFLEDVVTKQKGDGMESFFLAETMKYLYLLLSDEGRISLDEVVFNTEAHPYKKEDVMKLNKPVNPYYSRTDTTMLDLPDSEWRKVLSPEVYAIAREKDTEREYSGKYWDYDGIGTYYCAACGNALFRSDSKFASSCGWPSFFGTLRKNAVLYEPDHSHGLDRIEVLCGRCKGHLGHLFDDGPPPTGKRYCMNSVVLEFEPGE